MPMSQTNRRFEWHLPNSASTFPKVGLIYQRMACFDCTRYYIMHGRVSHYAVRHFNLLFDIPPT